MKIISKKLSIKIKKFSWPLFVDELKVGVWAKRLGDLEHGVALNW